MDRFLFIVCIAALAATPASADDTRKHAGTNASVEGGASLGGTGIDTTPRGTGLRIPDGDRPGIRVPLGKPRDENASAGASTPERRGGTDLGYEAEKEEEEFLKRQRTAPLRKK